MSLNPVFNEYVLRRLYDSDKKGNQKNRERVHTTITPETFETFSEQIPFRRGGFGAAITELSYRMMLAIIGVLDIEEVGEELALATFASRKLVAANLYKLAVFVDQYEVEDVALEK